MGRSVSCVEVHTTRFPRRKHVSKGCASFHEQANFFVAKGLLAATLPKGSTLLHNGVLCVLV